MSHRVKATLKIQSAEIFVATCKKLDLPHQVGAVDLELYSGTIRVDATVQLPGWQYRVGVTFKTGDLQYDNYNGHWGKEDKLDAFVHEYRVQKTMAEAQKLYGPKGYKIVRVPAANGQERIEAIHP